MFEVTISVDGIIKNIMINANDSFQVTNIVTNMYGNGRVQIINIRRVSWKIKIYWKYLKMQNIFIK